MRDQPAKRALPVRSSVMNAQNAVVGLRGRDLFSTLRSLALDLTSTRSLVNAAWSLQRAAHGEQAYWALVGLASVLGQIGVGLLELLVAVLQAYVFSFLATIFISGAVHKH